MAPGDSTIVVSAFDPQYLGPFTLKVDCTFPFDLVPIPQEGAGMYDKAIRGSW
jgi:calpain-7